MTRTRASTQWTVACWNLVCTQSPFQRWGVTSARHRLDVDATPNPPPLFFHTPRWRRHYDRGAREAREREELLTRRSTGVSSIVLDNYAAENQSLNRSNAMVGEFLET